MITLADFLGYIILGFIIAYMVGYALIGIISLFKNLR